MPCTDEVTVTILGRTGPVLSTGTYTPEDGASTEYDCTRGSGPGWTCDADGTLHIYTSATRIEIFAYGADATDGGAWFTPAWQPGGTPECPSGCEVASLTLTLDPYDTGCFVASDTGGCR